MNIYSRKTLKAKNQERDKPDATALSAYVESLRLHVKTNPNLDATLKTTIDSLPSPARVRTSLSNEEARLLYETVDWAWKKITGHDIIEELKVKAGPEHLMGNYWILRNGVILSGENHFTIIKQNMNMFSALLKIGATTMLGHMGSSPNKAIKCAIDNGAIRLYVNSKTELYAQMTDTTYGEWGKDKIKALDFKNKVVKIIDVRQPYVGWNNGIVVRL